MAGRHKRDNLPESVSKADKADKSGREAANLAKSKIKNNLINYTKQLTSLGALQQVIVRNLQKEIENLEL